jgi:hypothetical protein
LAGHVGDERDGLFAEDDPTVTYAGGRCSRNILITKWTDRIACRLKTLPNRAAHTLVALQLFPVGDVEVVPTRDG